MASTIEIGFSSNPSIISSFINFKVNGSGYLNGLKETFRPLRQGNFQTSVGATIAVTVFNLQSAFNADYNSNNAFNVQRIGSGSDTKLRITSQIDNYFTQEDFLSDVSGITAVFTNVPFVPDLSISSITFTEASTPCLLINAVVTTSEQVDSYTLLGGSSVNVSTNPFTVPSLSRGVKIGIIVLKGSNTASGNLKSPSGSVNSQLTTSYLNSPSGATLTLSIPAIPLVTFTYSLDGTTYQTNNVFTGIVAGNYTVYAKDSYGCIITSTVTIPAFSDGGIGERFPYSDLPSKSNSIRFAKYIDWGVCTDYKNDENTLSFQLPYTENACEYNQLFQDCDIITTQIKTNYSTIAVTVIDEALVEYIVPVVQKTFYTNLKDRRDARIYNIGGLGQQTGIYFTLGNLYDYSLGTVTGTYVLNGNLPPYGQIGNFIFVNLGWFRIDNIIYDESVNAYVLVLDSSYTGSDAAVQVSAVYNLEPYNIFEFVIDMSSYQDKKIQVNITQTDDDVSFPQQVYLSEVIEVATVHEGTICIDYYNDNNTDIFYATGIKNRIRMPIESMSGTVIDDTDSERTDINTYLISAEGYESDVVSFNLMPKQMMRKVVQSLSHKFVFLNDVQYVKEESPDVVGLLGTNLYRINASMTKSNAVYTSRGIGQEFAPGTLEVASLLRLSSEGYLKIKK